MSCAPALLLLHVGGVCSCSCLPCVDWAALYIPGLEAESGDPGVAQEVSTCSVCCLSPMASVALVPRAEQDIRAALNVLALNFDLKDKVVEEPLKVGVRNLEEFWFLCEDEAKVGTFVGKLGLGDEEHGQPLVSISLTWSKFAPKLPWQIWTPSWKSRSFVVPSRRPGSVTALGSLLRRIRAMLLCRVSYRNGCFASLMCGRCGLSSFNWAPSKRKGDWATASSRSANCARSSSPTPLQALSPSLAYLTLPKSKCWREFHRICQGAPGRRAAALLQGQEGGAPLGSRARGGLAQARDAEERYSCPIASRAQAQSRVEVLGRTHGEWQSHSTPAFVMASAVAPAATRAVAAELAAARWFCKLCLETRSWQTFHGVSQARDLAVQCKAAAAKTASWSWSWRMPVWVKQVMSGIHPQYEVSGSVAHRDTQQPSAKLRPRLDGSQERTWLGRLTMLPLTSLLLWWTSTSRRLPSVRPAMYSGSSYSSTPA